MSILILVIPMALILGIGFIYAFFWATSDGQFDDLSTPAMRVLEKDPDNTKISQLNTFDINKNKLNETFNKKQKQ